MAAGKEIILYYNKENPQYLRKLKGTFVRLGIRIRNIAPEQVIQKVGYLAGFPGYEKADEREEIPALSEEMLVMGNFTQRRMEQLLSELRRAKVPPIPLKAIITETNADWSFYELYQEIACEHERMTAKKAKVIRIEEPDFGCEGRMEQEPVKDKVFLQWLDSGEIFETEEEDARLLANQVEEGDEVLVTSKGRVIPLETAQTVEH